MIKTLEKVPRRKFALREEGNSRLPKSVPIIGIGGSAFSTFFLPTDEGKLSSSTVDLSFQQLTVDNVHKNHPKVQEWISIIKYAIIKWGINFIDTAAWYGYGLSEVVIGYALDEIFKETKTSRTDLIINTKIGRYDKEPIKQFDYSYYRTIEATKVSIQRMNCQYIDILQLHDPEYSPSIQLLLDETIPAMIYCRDKLNLCRALGITGYPLQIQHEILVRSSQLQLTKKSTTTFPSMIFDTSLTYCHFNLHDSSLFSTSNIDSDAYPNVEDLDSSSFHYQEEEDNNNKISFASFCYDNSIGLMAAAPYSMGLLTSKGHQPWHPASLDLRFACKETQLYCDRYQVSLSSLALLYALSQPAIACTIVGMGSIDEVDHACTIACRFSNLKIEDCGYVKSQGIQRLPLTDTEQHVLSHVLDRENGPFAGVYKSGLYQWDGMVLASQFWEQCPGGKVVAEAQMRIRIQ